MINQKGKGAEGSTGKRKNGSHLKTIGNTDKIFHAHTPGEYVQICAGGLFRAKMQYNDDTNTRRTIHDYTGTSTFVPNEPNKVQIRF